MAPKIYQQVQLFYLGVRSNISRVRTCNKRDEALKLLFWPTPWYHIPPYLSPTEIQSDPSIVGYRQTDYYNLRGVDLFRMRDTPLCSLYRLYELLCAREHVHLVEEVTYFFYRHSHRWALCEIPDPKDPDPVRYAILASMVETLVESFNWRLGLGILRKFGKRVETRPLPSEVLDMREVEPDWVSRVPPLDETFVLFTKMEVERLNIGKFFKKRNLVVNAAEFFFI